MTQSQILSRLSRLGLLSVFCTGLFLATGELSMSTDGVVQIGNGGIQSAMAANQNSTDATNATINSIISFLNLGIGVLTFLITPLIMLAGWLLSPDWTFGEIFGLRPILHQLWILVSNVVYVIFGFMLVFIAFANIFGGESSKAYEMKTMLPKLVTGMLIVPFTWFIVSAVLSISNILTASVISLPMETILKAGGETSKLLADPIIPKQITFNKNTDTGTESTTTEVKNGNFTASNCKTDSKNCLSIKEFLTNGGGGAYNLLSVYAYGIFRIQDYKALTPEEKVNKVLDIAYKLGFGTIFFLVFGILVIAIVYSLFSRAAMLWLYAMFSPLFALTYVLGDKAKKLEKFTIKEFVSLALVPVYVSAALAFGLMFLGLVMGATSQGTTGDNGKIKSSVVNIETKDATTTFTFGTGDKGVTFTSIGLLDSESKAGISTALDIGKGVIGTIIMNILALGILWMAVMAALGASKITEAAVAPIKGFGDEIGKLAMKTPQYIPIPLGGKNEDGSRRTLSMAGMQNVGSGIHEKVKNMAVSGSTEIGQKFGEKVGNAIGLHGSKVEAALSKISAASKNANYENLKGNPQTLGAKVREVITSGGVDGELAITNPQIRASIVEEIRKAYDLKPEDVKDLGNAVDSTKFNEEFRKLAQTHKKGLEYLADGTQGYNTDNISSIFNGSISASGITITDKNFTSITVNGKKATIAPVEKFTEKTLFTERTEMTISRTEFNKLVTETGLKAEELEKELKSKNISIT